MCDNEISKVFLIQAYVGSYFIQGLYLGTLNRGLLDKVTCKMS